jgi:hypothetical protein
MIISDLNHIEVVSEETETSIVGGASPPFFFNVFNPGPPPAFVAPKGQGTYTSIITSKSGSGSSFTGSTIVSYSWY